MEKLISGRWEHIPCDDDYADSYRLKVPGGWIVRSVVRGSGGGVHQILIKDSKHTWVLEDDQTTIS